MKSLVFNSLLVATPIALVFLMIRALPDRGPVAPAVVQLSVQPVELAPVKGPLQLGGAWTLQARDRRFGGLSSLAFDDGRFLAISDRGAVIRFPRPDAPRHEVQISDLLVGPGPFGKKWGRDAESLTRDPKGRGWWIGFEQRHSLWLYDDDFRQAQGVVRLDGLGWSDNGGAEGLVVADGKLLVLGENGRDAILVGLGSKHRLKMHAGTQVADAAKAPDGSIWLLLRAPGLDGITQYIAPLLPTHDGYTVGASSRLPKGPLDNFEGMLIERRAAGEWRFWIVSDNDYRSLARTLLVALDVNMSDRHDKSPAAGAGLSKKPSVETP